MKTVLFLVSTDRFSIPLIRYLVLEGKRYGWKTCIASMFDNSFVSRIREEKVSNDLIFISITDFIQCDHAIRKSDLVIGMVPDIMLLQIVDRCIKHRKPLVAPSKLTKQLFSRKAAAEENDTLILLECGFSPGIDHITAKNVIDNIRVKKGSISSFQTYAGSLISDSGIDNPWQYKLTEPTSDVINIGKGNNRHLINNQLQHIPYHSLFGRQKHFDLSGMKRTVVIPEGDALYCKKIYNLHDAHTVIKGRVVREGFSHIWKVLVQLGFTSNIPKIDMLNDRSFINYMRSLVPYDPEEPFEFSLRRYTGATAAEIEKLKWLGMFDDEWVDGNREVTPAVILKYMMDKKLAMGNHDKDCIVMRHELGYSTQEYDHHFRATLIAQGEDQRNSALAKAIGLTVGAATKAILLENIKLKGIHTPIVKEIYEPVLAELLDLGVAFHVEEKRFRKEEVNIFSEEKKV